MEVWKKCKYTKDGVPVIPKDHNFYLTKDGSCNLCGKQIPFPNNKNAKKSSTPMRDYNRTIINH